MTSRIVIPMEIQINQRCKSSLILEFNMLCTCPHNQNVRKHKTEWQNLINRIVQHGKELRSWLVQSTAESRLSSQLRQSCSGLHPNTESKQHMWTAFLNFLTVLMGGKAFLFFPNLEIIVFSQNQHTRIYYCQLSVWGPNTSCALSSLWIDSGTTFLLSR